MIALLSLLPLLAGPAAARDAVEIQALRVAQDGYGNPSLTVLSHVEGRVSASLSCAGKRFGLDTAVAPGGSYTVVLEGLPRGSHACRGSLALQAADGTAGEMPLSFDVRVLPPLTLSVDREDLDLEGRRLVVESDRPLSSVEVRALDEHGQAVGQGSTPAMGARQVDLQWTQPGDAEIVKLEVVARDTDDLPGLLELSPWSYDIPHEDVVFETGRSEVRPGEESKLEKAWADLQRVLDKYGDVVEVELYVAGFTDTVGGAASNQALSLDRARSIARWFRQRGVPGPIYYQGFGESVLAVVTPDETPEEANRRALYLLAAEPPPVSDDLPRDDWTRLR